MEPTALLLKQIGENAKIQSKFPINEMTEVIYSHSAADGISLRRSKCKPKNKQAT